MLRINVYNSNQRGQLTHPGGALEFGRGPQRQSPRYCILDPTVSKDQLRVELLEEGRLAVCNLSRKNHVTLDDGERIPPGGTRILDLPTRLCAGRTWIEIETDSTDLVTPDSLQTIAAPQPWAPEQAVRALADLRDSPDLETLARWFETLVTVQRSAATSSEFYFQTARAVVELVGFDAGLVVLRRGSSWEVAAEHPGDSEAPTDASRGLMSPARPKGRSVRLSQTVLDFVLRERRTFYEIAGRVPLTESLSQVEAVVASPVLDRHGQVAGAVYGVRFRDAGAAGAGVRALEAQVVQVLAAAVGAGVTRLEVEAEALRRRLELEQMQFQLHVARDIQAGFFPRHLPAIEGYELAGQTQPADAVGGDYYDCLPLSGGRFGLTVADVSGHGLGPSLLMAGLRTALRGLVTVEQEPAKLLTQLNVALYEDLTPRHKFISMLYGVLDPAQHEFRYANAGHGPAVLHLAADQLKFTSLAEDAAQGCPLGIIRDEYRACQSVWLAPGDLLVLASDGVVETRRQKETFGLGRLRALLIEHRAAPLEKLRDIILQATTAFHPANRPDDDLTLLVLRRK